MLRKTLVALGATLALTGGLAGTAQAQVRGLPVPPILSKPVMPKLPACFRNQKEALDWINQAYEVVLELAHNRQALDAYIGRLKVSISDQPPAVQAQFGNELTELTRSSALLDNEIRTLEAYIHGNLKIPYCPPAVAKEEARPAAAKLIGYTRYEGRSISVYDNLNGTHTVFTEAGGATTSETRPNVSAGR